MQEPIRPSERSLMIDRAQSFLLRDSPQFAQYSEWLAELMTNFVEEEHRRAAAKSEAPDVELSEKKCTCCGSFFSPDNEYQDCCSALCEERQDEYDAEHGIIRRT